MCTCAVVRYVSEIKKSEPPQEFAICDSKCNIEKRVKFRDYLEREEKKISLPTFFYEIELISMKFLHHFCKIPVFQTSRTTSLYNQDPHCMLSKFSDLLPMNSPWPFISVYMVIDRIK